MHAFGKTSVSVCSLKQLNHYLASFVQFGCESLSERMHRYDTEAWKDLLSEVQRPGMKHLAAEVCPPVAAAEPPYLHFLNSVPMANTCNGSIMATTKTAAC
jgi:hypothetical protein